MIVAVFSETIETEWASSPAVRVGPVPGGQGAPDRHVLVTRSSERLLRIQVYARHPDCFAFEEAIVWRDHVVVGVGSDVHLVSLSDRSPRSFSLGSYFGHLYPADDYLLVASGERVFRIEPDRRLLWRSDVVGIDGVVLSDPGPPLIRGEGEWDPPGGWAPFALLSETGALVQAAP